MSDLSNDSPHVLAISRQHCHTGENPYWVPDPLDPSNRPGFVWWTDIPEGKLYRHDLAAGRTDVVYEGEPVGGFTLQADGSWLLFRVEDVAVLPPDGGVARTVLRYTDAGMKRFNDVIADPEGRVYAGTIGETNESGGLYRVDLDGTVTPLFAGTRVANGMGFTPDLRRFYWTDTTNARIDSFAYDRQTGELSDRRTFYQGDREKEGGPDGLTIDADGYVWSARWGGSRFRGHHPEDGRVVADVTMPVPRVSSVFLGGPNLDRFYATTAHGGHAQKTPEDGTTYEVRGVTRDGRPVVGRPEFRSRIRV